ncbi:protein-S-isoprenylcysteine O-methyltransferase [[Candida] jaroonii]|uniref:Protein-S-isoprenylcysteine O-methyltransferase n=1 Tax=[Candida] jaroonii TaxID=467808 RepID=A0ACA9Y447_9ASCO|nr:protein-S-isoprenylcysteine O-methyltransferase [[Candida] jaroonii]
MYDTEKVVIWKVVVRSFGLGIVLAICSNCLLLGYDIKLSLYGISLVIFHLLEFLITAICNSSQLEDDSFILHDYQLLLVNVVSALEYVVYKYFGFESNWRQLFAGSVLVIVGQVCRSMAMITAGESFNHYIQRSKNETHVLVTDGIYSVSRHPSYFGFFWWFIGLRIFLGSWITLGFGGYQIWNFFNQRIKFEEGLLMKFFSDYGDYRKKVSIGIPFIYPEEIEEDEEDEKEEETNKDK